MSDKVFPIVLFGFEFVDMMMLVLIALWAGSVKGISTILKGKISLVLIIILTVVLWSAGFCMILFYGRGDF